MLIFASFHLFIFQSMFWISFYSRFRQFRLFASMYNLVAIACYSLVQPTISYFRDHPPNATARDFKHWFQCSTHGATPLNVSLRYSLVVNCYIYFSIHVFLSTQHPTYLFVRYIFSWKYLFSVDTTTYHLYIFSLSCEHSYK